MGEYIHKWKLAYFQNALFQEFNDKENHFYHGNEWDDQPRSTKATKRVIFMLVYFVLIIHFFH
jgi:hypothetical protein